MRKAIGFKKRKNDGQVFPVFSGRPRGKTSKRKNVTSLSVSAPQKLQPPEKIEYPGFRVDTQQRVFMSPAKFLSLTTPPMYGTTGDGLDFHQPSIDGIESAIRKGEPFYSLLLEVDPSGHVRGHEGRHRAFVAYKNEWTEVPVVLAHVDFDHHSEMVTKHSLYQIEDLQPQYHSEGLTGLDALKKHFPEAGGKRRRDRYATAVWMQEYGAAKRNVDGIRKNIDSGALPKDHPALQKNIDRMERAKRELKRLGTETGGKTRLYRSKDWIVNVTVEAKSTDLGPMGSQLHIHSDTPIDYREAERRAKTVKPTLLRQPAEVLRVNEVCAKEVWDKRLRDRRRDGGKCRVDQLSVGTSVEMEHTKDPNIAREIAQDHLREFPCYYDYLLPMEARMARKGGKVGSTLFIIDENIPPKTARDLRTMGYRAYHTKEIFKDRGVPERGVSDERIKNYAEQHNAVVLTRDTLSFPEPRGRGDRVIVRDVPGESSTEEVVQRIRDLGWGD